MSSRLQSMSLAMLAALASGTGSASQPIEFWNISRTFAGQGQCSAAFLFDSQTQPVTGLQITWRLRGADGITLDEGTVDVPDFGHGAVDRYQQAAVESPHACDDAATLEVTRASLLRAGARVDLVGSGGLQPLDFKPMPVHIATPPADSAARPDPDAGMR